MSDLNVTVNSIPMTYEKKKERSKEKAKSRLQSISKQHNIIF